MRTEPLTNRALKCLSRTLFLWIVATSLRTSAGLDASEWPTWRGAKRDAICSETGLLNAWPEEGPPLLWKVRGLGEGFSSLAVSGKRLFTLGVGAPAETPDKEGREEQDEDDGTAFLVARGLDDGKPLWSTRVGPGKPNGTPTVSDGRVYALGREGDLVCVEEDTGKEVWRKNFAKDFGGKMMSGWGYSESPLVDGDWLLCTPGGKDALVVALDARTGAVVWKAASPEIGDAGSDGAGYSSVVVSEACGVRQYVQLTGRGVVSFRAKDGAFLWGYNRVANDVANIPTPVVRGDHVFCSTGYGTGAALLRIVPASEAGVDGTPALRAEEVYFLKGKTMQNHHGGMVLIDKYLYCGHGNNKGFPLCVELETGDIAWRPGRGPGEGSAAVLFADGHLYFRYQDGLMALIEADPTEYRLKGTFRIASDLGESWPHPVISNGRLFLRDQDALLCYDIRLH